MRSPVAAGRVLGAADAFLRGRSWLGAEPSLGGLLGSLSRLDSGWLYLPACKTEAKPAARVLPAARMLPERLGKTRQVSGMQVL